MRLFFNISHPAHVHFFKNAIKILQDRGHEVIIGARDKEFTTRLLDALGFKFTILTKKRKGFFGLLYELGEQQAKIGHLITTTGRFDLMCQISGIFNAPIGRVLRIPTLAFSDTENDRLGNSLSFFLSRHVFLTSCFDHAAGGSWAKQIHYPGYHELAYLSPTFFPHELKANARFLLRFVGWGAGHDIGEKSLTDKQKIELAQLLQPFGEVVISSEAPLPAEITHLSAKFHPLHVHEFMTTCKLVIGESATMASEAACLGIPAVYIADTGRGYTTEQDQKFDLIRHYRLDQWPLIIETVSQWARQDLAAEWQAKRWRMLLDKIDVTLWLVDLIENYPDSLNLIKKGDFERYKIKCAV